VSAPPPIEPPGVFEGLRPGAILFGAVVDNLATLAASLLLLLAFSAGLAFDEAGEVDEEQVEALMHSTGFLLASLVAGTLCTVLGAYLGARRAARAHLRHGGWIAVASAAFALLFYVPPGEGASVPVWLDLAGWLLILPAGLAGGALAAHRAAEDEGGL
jgi:hypothetical protein